MKYKENETISDDELVELFKQATLIQEKLGYFAGIQDENRKIELLDSIPQNEKYKFIGKLRHQQDIAEQLSKIEDEKSKRKTFNYLVKQYKGNSKKLLELLECIDFEVRLPENMLTFMLNNLNDVSMDSLIRIQQSVENSSDMKFKVNEKDAENVEYSFAELSAITAKIEELTAGISPDLSEVEKFYTIYFRIINNITYNHDTVNRTNEERKKRFDEVFGSLSSYEERKKVGEKYDKKISEIRKDSAGLYGGLVDGKAICVGYATILQEALKRQSIKSLIVVGTRKDNFTEGHAWNQVQIDDKWYNVDATWDASMVQRTGDIAFMLRGDDTFNHNEYTIDTPNAHTCKKDCPLENSRFMRIVNQNRWWGGIKGGR